MFLILMKKTVCAPLGTTGGCASALTRMPASGQSGRPDGSGAGTSGLPVPAGGLDAPGTDGVSTVGVADGVASAVADGLDAAAGVLDAVLAALFLPASS